MYREDEEADVGFCEHENPSVSYRLRDDAKSIEGDDRQRANLDRYEVMVSEAVRYATRGAVQPFPQERRGQRQHDL